MRVVKRVYWAVRARFIKPEPQTVAEIVKAFDKVIQQLSTHEVAMETKAVNLEEDIAKLQADLVVAQSERSRAVKVRHNIKQIIEVD